MKNRHACRAIVFRPLSLLPFSGVRCSPSPPARSPYNDEFAARVPDLVRKRELGPVDPRARGAAGLEKHTEFGHCGGGALGLANNRPAVRVANPAREPERVGALFRVFAEKHALDLAKDLKTETCGRHPVLQTLLFFFFSTPLAFFDFFFFSLRTLWSAQKKKKKKTRKKMATYFNNAENALKRARGT
jgi:hypothetical protein